MDEASVISLEALKQGDRQEFARLVDLYAGQVYRLALKMLNDPLDAEDVLQNTFLKALQSIDTFEGRSSLSTWLYRIAANEALMLLRRQRSEVSLGDSSSDDDHDDEYTPREFTDWCCLPEEEFLTAESRQALDDAIQKLPEKLRIVFVLRDIEGLSIEETSRVLGLSEAAVKTRLLRARLHLRNTLSFYFRERVAERKS
ncbi:MAG: sigma-70 family RNA polymerase sigma factor [Anaerolineales bacterium]|nr:sigma-70 family RNA polymerase sigma factor [Anaerolineales bacterium]MCX7609184.1 sigma-70 family RNA polymerase sigma factor [Anaerolineales bacterium]MDW8227779.1 sigma-70 family RNA polymerase sigma factor [Anaerolineales bacterium]